MLEASKISVRNDTKISSNLLSRSTSAEPGVGAEVVPVEPDPADRIALARRGRLVEAAHQAVPVEPVGERVEERPTGQGRPWLVEVPPEGDGFGAAVVVLQRPQPGERVVAERAGEVRAPGGQPGQFVLEEPADGSAEPGADPAGVLA